jgi:DNA-binding LacI/PurR family transcriptional regulator
MDILACGALQAIRESGRVVPRDISVIGVDNSEFAETCYPRLTSLDNMIIESSVEISTRVISNLEGSPSSVRKIMLFTRIMERDTT